MSLLKNDQLLPASLYYPAPGEVPGADKYPAFAQQPQKKQALPASVYY